MTRNKKITRKEVLAQLNRLDGTLMVTDDELRRIRNDLAENPTPTVDDLARLRGVEAQLKLLIAVSQETRQQISSFIRTTASQSNTGS